MTLIVTSVAEDGIVMAADSAVTLRLGRNAQESEGAAKVFFLEDMNVGFSTWGLAVVARDGQFIAVDQWLSEVVDDFAERPDMSLRQTATTLSDRLTERLQDWREMHHNPPWELMKRGGIHIAGYEDSQPQIWHVTTGRPREEARAPRVVQEFPQSDPCDGHVVSDGPYGDFELWDGATDVLNQAFRKVAEPDLGSAEPGTQRLAARFEHLRATIVQAASELQAQQESGVNDIVYGVGFTEDTLVVDERPPLVDWLPQ